MQQWAYTNTTVREIDWSENGGCSNGLTNAREID